MLEHLPQRLQKRITAELGAGEETWWAGQPSALRNSPESWLSLLIFGGLGVMALGIAVAMTRLHWREAATADHDLHTLSGLWDAYAIYGWAALFLLAGLLGLILGLAHGPVALLAAARTAYVVTSRCALVIAQDVRSVPPERMPFLEKLPGRALFFGREVATDSEGNPYVRRFGFEHMVGTTAAECALLRLMRERTPAITTADREAAAAAGAPASPSAAQVPFALRQAVQAELEPGERLVWLGRPLSRAAMSEEAPGYGHQAAGCLGLVLGTWLVTKLMQFLSGSDDNLLLRGPAGWFVLGVIAVLVVMMLGRGLSDWRRRDNTAYAVTDRRAMLVNEAAVRSFVPAQPRGPAIEDGPDGLRAVYFFEETHEASLSTQRIGFEALGDAADAAALRRLAQASAGAPIA